MGRSNSSTLQQPVTGKTDGTSTPYPAKVTNRHIPKVTHPIILSQKAQLPIYFIKIRTQIPILNPLQTKKNTPNTVTTHVPQYRKDNRGAWRFPRIARQHSNKEYCQDENEFAGSIKYRYLSHQIHYFLDIQFHSLVNRSVQNTWLWRIAEMILTGEKPKNTRRKKHVLVPLCPPKNVMWTGLELNADFHGETPANNLLSHSLPMGQAILTSIIFKYSARAAQ